MNYMPVEESHKVHNISSEIESLRTSLNAIYIDVIKNAESAQIKFQEAISSSFHIEEKLELQSLIRMYSINVPLVKSVNFTHKAGDDDIYLQDDDM